MQSNQRDIYIESIKQRLSPERFRHCMGVEKAAIQLAKRYDVDLEKASTAALLHDYAKELPKQQLLLLARKYNIVVDDIIQTSLGLLHGPVASWLVKEKFKITDVQILDAIKNHTVGAKRMSKLEKIIYLADLIEETREFSGINTIREAAMNNLNEAMRMALTCEVVYTMQHCRAVHPNSIDAYNDLVTSQKEKENEAI